MNKKLFLFGTMLCLWLLMPMSSWASPLESPISIGTRGSDVEYVQRLLAQSGYYQGEIDGIFGNDTHQAVVSFQRSSELPVDGVVDSSLVKYLERASAQTSRFGRSIRMQATAYSAYDPGNGSYTAAGHFLRKGLVAVDPNVIPLGTRLYIPGYGYAIADDTGGAIVGNRIDLAFDSRWEALQFGRRAVTVYILE